MQGHGFIGSSQPFTVLQAQAHQVHTSTLRGLAGPVRGGSRPLTVHPLSIPVSLAFSIQQHRVMQHVACSM